MERTMLRKLMIVAVLSTSAACATGYQVDGFKGGQEPKWRAVDVLEIKARGNGYTSSKKLGRMTLLRAAESAIEAKYRYFIEIGSENKGRESTAYLPTTTTNTYTGSYVGNTYTGTTTSYTTGGPISVFKPGVDAVYRMFTELPADARPGQFYDAYEIYNEFGPKFIDGFEPKYPPAR